METQEKIAQLIPRLRRYARALASAGKPPDELVRRTLERASQELRVAHAEADLRVWLFSLLHDIYVQEAALQDAGSLAGSAPARAVSGAPPFDQAISTLPPQQSEIFLLFTLVAMSYELVAQTLTLTLVTGHSPL